MKTFNAYRMKLEDVRQEEGKGILRGWANMFRKDGKRVIDRHGDYLMPGSLPGPKTVPFLMGHDASQPVGSCYCYEENDHKGNVGIRFEARLDIDSPSKRIRERAREAFYGAQKGLYPYTSIGFIALDASHGRDPETKKPIFIIKKIDLVELSLVTTPANPHAAVEQVLGRIDNPDEELKDSHGKTYGITWGQFQKILVDTLTDPKVRGTIGEDRMKNLWRDHEAIHELGFFIEDHRARAYVQNYLSPTVPMLMVLRQNDEL